MIGLKKDKHLQIRFSEAELDKYKQVARDNGLSLSGFARYSMARASNTFCNIKKEL